MTTAPWIAALAATAGLEWLGASATMAASGRFEPLARQGETDVLVWRDISNVYVLRNGDAAVLIDIGDGSVLDHLGDIGVRRLEWVLLTHHHREQCQGHPKLRAWKPQVAAPQAERAILERPADFRRMKPSLGDRFTVHGASFVRPPVEPLAVDRGLAARDTFTWRGHEMWCLQTAGNSPGGMSYLLKTDGGWLAFSGDVMVPGPPRSRDDDRRRDEVPAAHGGRMHNWFDTEWDYGFASGLYALIGSANLLESFEPAMLLPAHGPILRDARAELHAYQRKLRDLAALLVRGYTIGTFEAADTDNTSRPSEVPHLWQVTKHLYKFRGPNYGPNCTFLLADTGRALIVDCGLGKAELDATVEQMQKRLGLRAIDGVFVTHMHGDHCLDAPYVRQRYGAKLYTLDRVAGPIEQPHRFDYAAQPWSYSADAGPIKFDRLLKSGEKLGWEGFDLTFDWMPGQTEFACCIHGVIDGKRVAFTGDNLFGNADDPNQTGHEAVCARNSAILEEGYIYGSQYLRHLRPDIIVAGHSFVMDRPRAMIDRFCRWSVAMRDAFRTVSDEQDYRLIFDPYWVRADPYRLALTAGGTAELKVNVRNFLPGPWPRKYRIALHLPEGLAADPAILEGTVAPESTVAIPVKLTAGGGLKSGVRIVAMDTTFDGKRYGEWFDFIVGIGVAAK